MFAPVNREFVPWAWPCGAQPTGLGMCHALAGLDAIVLPPPKGAIRVQVQELGEFLRNVRADRSVGSRVLFQLFDAHQEVSKQVYLQRRHLVPQPAENFAVARGEVNDTFDRDCFWHSWGTVHPVLYFPGHSDYHNFPEG